MTDLQATFEFSIELYKFYNVDLFQRGLYQVRVGLRVSPRLPVQIEASVASGNNNARAGRFNAATLVGGLAASRAFQIMYRNEEVTLRDIVHFRAQLLVDSRNLKESLERAEWSIGVELWFGESGQSAALTAVCCRVLKLHFQPSQGLHYHLPVLFDYFHLSAVTITIHACLVALHQPYINTPRSSKQWGKLMKTASSFGGSSLENVLFGSVPKCAGNMASKGAHARQVHAEVCGFLLGSLEGLQSALATCGSAGAALTPDETASNFIIEQVTERLHSFNHNDDVDDSEEKFACGAAHDIARLCAEVTVRWRAFLHAVLDRPHVHHALAARHHALRIKRFSECFFVMDNPRHSLGGCYDSNWQSYAAVGEAARKSRYLALLPWLPVHCMEMDGDSQIMPIIFEDRYQDTAEFARRRSVLSTSNNSKFGSDPFLCSAQYKSDCICDVSNNRPASAASKPLTMSRALVDITEPRLNKQSVIEAKLTLAPHQSKHHNQIFDLKKQVTTKELSTRYIVHNNYINEIPVFENWQNNSRYSISNLYESRNKKNYSLVKHQQIGNNGINTLPTRHSKSLDYLKNSKLAPHPSHLTNSSDQPKHSTLPRTIKNYSHPNRINKNVVKDDDYRRNIKEFREKYKNPCSGNNEIIKNLPFTFNSTQIYSYSYNDRNYNRNPLDFQRCYTVDSSKPSLPPRNSYPPVNSKYQACEQVIAPINKNIHRSNSTQFVRQTEYKDSILRAKLTQELNNLLEKGQWCYDFSTNSLIHHVQKKSSKSSDDSGFVINMDRSSDGTSKSTCSKTPPSTSQSSTREKKNKTAKDLSRSKDSLSSHHSIRSKESKSDHITPKSDRSTPKSKSGNSSPRSGLATPKTNGKRIKHKPSEKMSQIMSKVASSSSNESIPFTLRRLENSSSVPYRLDHRQEVLRHSRSAASILDDTCGNNSIISESLPNLAPPPAFDSPILNKDYKNFKVKPTKLLKSKISRRSSTSSLSEQSGWVSSPSTGRSSPETFKNAYASTHNGNDNKVGDFKRTVLNGDQLRDKLLKLATDVAKSRKEKIECCDKTVCMDCAICNDSICTDAQCEYNKVHNDDTAVCNLDKLKYITNRSQKDLYTEVRKDHCVRKEVEKVPVGLKKTSLKHKIEYTEKLLAAELRNLTVERGKVRDPLKCRSDVDLSKLVEGNYYEHIHLPPPQQFCDAPPPPDAFRDPPLSKSPKLSRSSSKSSTSSRSQKHTLVSPSTSLQLDNPLYHVCEGVLERRKLRPQLSNGSASGANSLNKSQSTGELASRSDEDDRQNDLVSMFGLAESARLFVKCRAEFLRTSQFPGTLYSLLPPPNETSLPYFHIADEYRMFNPEGVHLVVCVHGLDGSAADLRLVRAYLELSLPGARLTCLMSERNQADTFSDFDTMTNRLVQEILTHIQNSGEPSRISFVGHSLGNIIIRSALARPQMKPYLSKLHTFLSLSGPHLGTLYNPSGLVNAGMWFMQKWKKSGSLLQLSLKDAADPRQSFLYRLSEKSQLHYFKNILLCGSGQDRYVPLHSARLELCKAAAKDNTPLGHAYREMVHNIVAPLSAEGSLTVVVRYSVVHQLAHTASALLGRAAHIAALDSDLFIEKFLLVSALKYFR